MASDIPYLVALSCFPKFGSRRLLKLKRAFSNYEEAFHAKLNDLMRAGIDENIATEFISERNKIEPEKEWGKLEKENIQVMALDDPNYPALLKEIYDPPALLYIKGRLEKGSDEFTLAVVGTRQITPYGRQITAEIVGPLARHGLTIVSGLALGVDALAHEVTLGQNGRTIAVLGSGLDEEHIYPSRNRQLAHRIIENNGAIISEFPIGTLPLRHHFPIRNRIISGLSLGTLIIEAAEDSGSLITARCALEQNRDVFSVPGSIFSPLSFGPNNLLKMGAKVITEAQDILEALNLEKAEDFIENQKILPDTAEEAAVLKILSREPIHIDEIIKQTSLPSHQVSSTLTLMEMKGKVRNLGGMMYVIAR